MKKIVIAVVVLIVIALAAAPLIIGSLIDSTTQEQADLAEQRMQELARTNPYITDASLKLVQRCVNNIHHIKPAKPSLDMST